MNFFGLLSYPCKGVHPNDESKRVQIDVSTQENAITSILVPSVD